MYEEEENRMVLAGVIHSHIIYHGVETESFELFIYVCCFINFCCVLSINLIIGKHQQKSDKIHMHAYSHPL